MLQETADSRKNLPAAALLVIACLLSQSIAVDSARAVEDRGTIQADSVAPPAAVTKLVFIHHSTGQNWLADDNGGLGIALGNNNYFVSDTNYGWGPNAIGDRTDIPDWLEWFRSADTPTTMAALYAESGQNSAYTRTLADPGGGNEIIMFKSCFPNSALAGNPGDPPSPDGWLTVGHAKYVYLQLLLYFQQHPDKLFVVITAPPLSDSTYAANARAFNQWLVNDWLSQNGYPLKNVAVFDFFNVLTSNGGNPSTNDLGWATGNHHRWRNGAIQHKTDGGSNVLAYPSGDDHPSEAGNLKATGEFVPVLNVVYNRWKNATNAAPTLGTVTPSALTSAPGVAQKFSAVYRDADGYANLKRVSFQVSTTTSRANGISLALDRTVNRLYLYKDAGTGYVGSCTPGAAGSLSNTRGTLNCAATTVSGSGNNLRVTWSITPQAAFVAATKKNIFVSARDVSTASVGWMDRGDWTIKATNVAPTLGTVTPAASTSAPGVAQKFSAVYRDADGYANLKRVHFQVSTTTSRANGISLVHDRTVNRLYLYKDAGAGYVGSCTPGAAGSLSNTRGTLNCAATTVTGSGNNLTVTWSINPKAAFVSAAKKNIYLYALDISPASAGWTDRGDWTIRTSAPLGEVDHPDSDGESLVIGNGGDAGPDE